MIISVKKEISVQDIIINAMFIMAIWLTGPSSYLLVVLVDLGPA